MANDQSESTSREDQPRTRGETTVNVTREVILDLLPVYLAGEASADTRQLVDEYMRQDAELGLDLFAERDLLVLPRAAVEITERHVAERADRREVTGA